MELFARFLIPRGYYDSSKPTQSTSSDNNNKSGETSHDNTEEGDADTITPTPPTTPMSPGNNCTTSFHISSIVLPTYSHYTIDLRYTK